MRNKRYKVCKKFIVDQDKLCAKWLEKLDADKIQWTLRLPVCQPSSLSLSTSLKGFYFFTTNLAYVQAPRWYSFTKWHAARVQLTQCELWMKRRIYCWCHCLLFTQYTICHLSLFHVRFFCSCAMLISVTWRNDCDDDDIVKTTWYKI